MNAPRNSATGVRTRVRQFRSASLKPLHYEGNLTSQLSPKKSNLSLATQISSLKFIQASNLSLATQISSHKFLPFCCGYLTATKRQKILDLAGSLLQDVLTIWMPWEILSGGVTPKTFPRTLSFIDTLNKSQSISPLIWYDTKQSDGEVPVILEFWGMQSTPSLPLFPGPLWPRMVEPDRVLSLG